MQLISISTDNSLVRVHKDKLSVHACTHIGGSFILHLEKGKQVKVNAYTSLRKICIGIYLVGGAL